MSGQATLQSIAFRPPKNFPLICRVAARTPAASPCQARFRSSTRLWYNPINADGAMSVILTNTKRQARYRERHLGVDGEQVRVRFNLYAATRRNRAALHTTLVIQ
jgi:hypothetical protein